MAFDDGIEPTGTTLDQELGAARVSVKGVRRDHARAAIAEALFGGDQPAEPVGPARLDRFVILDKLGRGGMGVVYSAYDPELDRRVAVKLLQSGRQDHDPDARARLLREAQALARLSHPNVVPVHDVGVIDDQVFIVMEFVVGRDLRAWQTADPSEPPGWRDVLDVYLQAGRGLAAAHEAGLVHRDFKPENALVGADGRVRVLDFGLARGGSPDAASPERPDNPDAGAPLLDVSMTVTGAVMGTPAYMSPEQFEGQHVGQASDQFSFCVALYEALYGARPFQGDTMAELGARLTAGDMVAPPRGSDVPGWLLPIVQRGLATAPDERYPSMAELLTALERDPARTRRRWLLAFAALALAALSAVTAYTARGDRASADPCADAGDVIADTWNDEHRAAVTAAIRATGHPYADQATALVSAKLDAYARDWAQLRVEACTSHRRGVQSGDLLDRRMSCLDSRRDALSSAVAVLRSTDVDAVENTVLVAEKLPSIAYCSDVAALDAAVPPPDDPQVAARVAALRRVLARARAEEDAGRRDEPLAAANDVLTAARSLGYQPLVAEALLVRGRLLMQQDDRKPAIEPLTEAALIGLRAGVDQVALEALARRLYVDGTTRQDDSEALGELNMGLALAERLPDGAFVSALMLNNAGTVELAGGDRAAARAYFAQALAIKQRATDVPLELMNIEKNLALTTDEPARRMQLLQQAHAEFTRALGPDHPLTVIAGLAVSSDTRPVQRAHALRLDGCERLQRYHSNHVAVIADCLYYTGQSYTELGQHERAVATWSRLAERLADVDDDVLVRFRALARGYAAHYQGQHDAAIAAFEQVLALQPAQQAPWWLARFSADARLGIGLSLHARGRHRDAIASIERALPVQEHVTTMVYRVEFKHQLALARSVLARALMAGAPSAQARERARELAQRAGAWYRDDRAGHAARLRELDDYGFQVLK